MKMLIVTNGYLPGYKYGGPVRSLASLVENLGDDIEFSIVTTGSDLGESSPYPGVRQDTWTRVGKADVWYTQKSRLSPTIWRRILSDRPPDVVYLNSFWATPSSAFLFWQRTRLLPKIPVLLAPRGEFASSALNLKRSKKHFIRFIFRLLRLHRGVVWQASSEAEAQDIRQQIGKGAPIMNVAPELKIGKPSSPTGMRKAPGEANFVWLGRVAPVKNLEGAVTFLKSIRSGDVTLTAYGPIEVQDTWNAVRAEAGKLPPFVTFEHGGVLSHDEVEPSLRKHQFLLFPTLGENFGHAIAEALGQGLPVLVSDRTPWRELEDAGVGWDIPLDNTEEWTRAINDCVAMDGDEYQAMSARCREYVSVWIEEQGGKQANLEMFGAMLSATYSR